MSPKRTTKQKARRNHNIVISTFLESSAKQQVWYSRAQGYLRNRDYPRLYSLAAELSTEVYDSASSFLLARQFAALILKYPWDPKEINLPSPRETAVQTFHMSEMACKRSNYRFTANRYARSRYAKYIWRAREEILALIGEEPNIGRILHECSFSSGANLEVHGGKTNLYRKLFSDRWTVTPSALPYAAAAICSNEQFLYSLSERRSGIACIARDVGIIADKARLVNSNKVDFVPKTAKTHRVIAVEPLLNSFVQKGIDVVLREKLLRWRIDLRDQSKNQRLARVGSIDGSLGTMDLSSASDSISTQLCRVLLPRSWFCLLDSTRSPCYELDGLEKRSEKFVSMGNGFCFPLETLIFASIVRSVFKIDGVPDRRYAVYGDDIIVPESAFDRIREVLTFCGFSLNKKKSFNEGPFRESCGADWYMGQDVRPVQLDYHLLGDAEYMIFHNSTNRSERVSNLFTEVRHVVRSWAHKCFVRPYDAYTPSKPGSSWLDVRNANGAFNVSQDTFMASRYAEWNREEQRWSWKEYFYTPVADHSSDPMFAFAAALVSIQEPGSRLNLRYQAKRRIATK